MRRDVKGTLFSFSPYTRFLALILGLFSFSCYSHDTTKSVSNSQVSAPIDFRLVIGEGGGFTGQWNGYTVDSLGTVFAWSGMMAEENPRRLTKLTHRLFNELWQNIEDARFFDVDASGTGNITQLMIVSANGKLHSASWAKGTVAESSTSPVQRLYASCRTVIGRGK
ncbi:MAG: hypothetical protein HW389_553 [Bacteroidetes bacterium]|nr:hypothetical protein [Bacteroidota bacterium]